MKNTNITALELTVIITALLAVFKITGILNCSWFYLFIPVILIAGIRLLKLIGLFILYRFLTKRFRRCRQ